MIVDGDSWLHPAAILDAEDIAQTVRVSFVGAEETEVLLLFVAREDIAHHLSQLAGRLVPLGGRFRYLYGIIFYWWNIQINPQFAAVGVRIGAHAPVAAWGQRRQFRQQTTIAVEQFLRLVAAHPLLQHSQVCRVGFDIRDRYLVGAEGIFNRHAIDLFGACPAFGRAHDDDGPRRALAKTMLTRIFLIATDAGVAGIEQVGEVSVHGLWIVAFDEKHLVAVA